MKRNMWYTRFINDNKVDMYCGHTFEQTYSFRLNKKKILSLVSRDHLDVYL